MKKLVVLFVIYVYFFILPLHSFTVHAQTDRETEKLKQIDNYILAEMKAAHIPGISLGIVKDEEIIHLKGYGHIDDSGNPVTAQTPFILGSTTKSFTAMAIMKLVEEGKIDLDAPIQTYLPTIKITNTKITVRNLLNQTSGISIAPNHKDDTWKIKNENIGRVFEYSNENYKLLGKIITSVTNKPYGEFITTNIFSPLEMKHSYTSQTLAKKNGLASGYRTWFGFNIANQLPYNNEDDLPAGFLISSAEDMAHYLIAHMNHGQYNNQTLISNSSIEEMHQPIVRAPIMGEDSYYGMGWFNIPINGISTIRHSGEVPNYHSTMIMMPNEKYGIIILANINNSILISGLIERIGEGVVDLLAGKQPATISSSTYYQTYMIMNGIIFIIIVLLFFHIKNIKKWNNRLANGKIVTFINPLMINIILPLSILTQLPKLLGFTWSFLFDFVPDVTSFIFSVSVILLLVGCFKLYMIAAYLTKKRKMDWLSQSNNS
ncbi:serine hydrolase [Lysinibacillus sp. BW-2-10]|uniref:serine hydrolase domain-containing protein n=1 Tax=Lysinibacillus sp. BW-2-10 TaxID=2590030 RepID=UPI00117C9E9F|nr:serine hydrolase domain-containing protein [Lysinibacillus sp. BW-2-10]TSI11075.1 beta-lactamase family protein [Lysinibacillus sp. BW-2-10]